MIVIFILFFLIFFLFTFFFLTFFFFTFFFFTFFLIKNTDKDTRKINITITFNRESYSFITREENKLNRTLRNICLPNQVIKHTSGKTTNNTTSFTTSGLKDNRILDLEILQSNLLLTTINQFLHWKHEVQKVLSFQYEGSPFQPIK